MHNMATLVFVKTRHKEYLKIFNINKRETLGIHLTLMSILPPDSLFTKLSKIDR